MKKTLTVVGALTLMWIGISSGAFGQRGMGDAEGIARQADKPEIVQLSGTIREVKTEPCKMTTGPSTKGTHVILETPSGEKLEIHLGPAEQIGKIVEKLAVDQQVAVAAFRTDKLPKDAYVAQTLTVDDKPIELRDKDLRPVWAGGGRKQMAGRGSQRGAGKGRWSAGEGAGAGGCAMCGRGQGQGRGAAKGRGQGQGRGAAMGRGQGQGRGCSGGNCGRGQGQGRGAAMGQGQGRGVAMGRGQGQGRGAAVGRGQGRGRGAGRGQGQGRGWGAGLGASVGDDADQDDDSDSDSDD